MSVRDELLARWGDPSSVEDVIGAYRRAMDAHGGAIRERILIRVSHLTGVEGLAWLEGARDLWAWVLAVDGRGTVPAAEPADRDPAAALPEPLLQDLGAHAMFWRTNQGFAYPLEFAFHDGRRSAFERLCRWGRVDPYTLRRPRREAER